MVVIRRMVDRQRAYTAIFLKGEEPKVFPTSDQEHARILQIFLQDRPHEGVVNDFSDLVAMLRLGDEPTKNPSQG